MANTHRSWISAVVMLSFVSLQTNAALCASENESSSTDTPASQSLADSTTPAQLTASGGSAPTIDVSSTSLPPAGHLDLTLPASFVSTQRSFAITPAPSRAFAGQIYQGRPYRMNHDGSIAALMIGAVTAIAGTALLVYANRPECTTNQLAGGCGYGTKVVGGAVLSAGVVGVVIGAVTW
jgi:hypothetical protein